MKKRILHISKYYYPFRGGTEQIARDCVNALSGQYNQKIICFNDINLDQKDVIDGIEVIRCGTFCTISSQGLSISIGEKLKKVINSFRPDIIIFHYPNPFVARYLLKYIPVNSKLVIYWHLDIVKQKILGKFFAKQNRELVKRANMIIATSPNYVEGSQWLSFAKNKCVVVPNCINVDRLQSTPEIDDMAAKIRKDNEGKTVCLAVGRHTEYKGFKYLIQAAHLLDDSFQIYIIGKGEETEKLKKEANNDKKVHFLGVVDDDTLKSYYIAMDIYCFPSVTKNEAFGLALAEGMYYGKPAITFTIPGSGVNYVCLNKENGIEIPNKNIILYAKALEFLASNKEIREKMGKAGKKRVETYFLNKHFAQNIMSAIGKL